MYDRQPSGELTLEDFELVAMDRLMVLKGIENAFSRGVHGRDLNVRIEALLAKHMGRDSIGKEGDETRRKDQVSHHILRLAYCQSEEKRRWFLTQELALFKYRLEKESPEQQTKFMKDNGLHYVPISETERAKLEMDLRKTHLATLNASSEQTFGLVKFYKVPFTQALDLVGSRKVLVRGGFAYVPRDKIVAIVTSRFRARLSYALVHASKALPAITRDERFGPILSNMSKAYVGPEFSKTTTGDKIGPGDVETLASSAFPMCMQNLHTALKRNHHLKHGGRMQYGLFLKGVGLGLDEALRFWADHFTKKMSAEDFLKRYAYNIRHNYGKEGKRADYTPYSCTKIILGGSPAADQAHGCPYRHWDANHLRAALQKMSLKSGAIDDVLSSVKTHDYQVACRKQFEARYGEINDNVGEHPNAYVREARIILHARSDSATAASAAPSPGTPAAPKAAKTPATAATPAHGARSS